MRLIFKLEEIPVKTITTIVPVFSDLFSDTVDGFVGIGIGGCVVEFVVGIDDDIVDCERKLIIKLGSN